MRIRDHRRRTSGRLDPELSLGVLCAGSEELPDDASTDMTVGELIEAVELAMEDGDEESYGFWSEVVDFVNNALVPGESGCVDSRAGSGRRRGR